MPNGNLSETLWTTYNQENIILCDIAWVNIKLEVLCADSNPRYIYYKLALYCKGISFYDDEDDHDDDKDDDTYDDVHKSQLHYHNRCHLLK